MQRSAYRYPYGPSKARDQRVFSPLLQQSPALGLYGDPGSVSVAEKTLKRPVECVTAYTDINTLTSNTFPFTDQWPGGQKLILSHTLMPTGGNMATYASGGFNSAYQQAADNLVPFRDRIICIRIGWEFNAPAIYPWCAGGAGTNQTQANYKNSFANFAIILKQTLPEIPISWCPLADNALADPWYPGDSFVDIIDVDQYLNSGFWSDNFLNNLQLMNNSLIWQEAFANAHGKMMGWSEWGTDYDTGIWLSKMAAWLKQPRQTRVFHQAYWDSDLNFACAFATHPNNKAAYIAAFGE